MTPLFSVNYVQKNLYSVPTFTYINSVSKFIVQNFISITDLENQLNSISEDYELILGNVYPPTHPALVTIKRKGF